MAMSARPRWREVLIREVIEQLFEQDTTCDLETLTKALQHHCPGNYVLAWKDPDRKWAGHELDDPGAIAILFDNNEDELEWRLRYS